MKNNPLHQFFHYVSFSVLGMIGLSCYILADTFFVARNLGSSGLAALNLSISIYSVIHATGLMIGIGGATKFGILKSRHQQNKGNSVFTHALALGAVIGIIFAVIGIFFSEKLSYLLGADEITFPLANIYLKTILIFTPAFIANNILIAFVRNDGNPNRAMAAMLLGSLANIVLDYVFMFPLKMGMFGAAFATCLAPIISILILLPHFKQENVVQIQKSNFKPHYLKDIGLLGTSSFITEISSGVVLIIFNLVILKIAGNVGVAAYGIVANLALVVMAIFTGVAQGIQPLASQSHGVGNHIVLSKILQYALVTAVVIAISIYGITMLFSTNIIAAFNSEKNVELAGLAKEGLLIYFTGFIFAGVNVVLAGFFSAIEKTGRAFGISIIRGAIAIIPLVLLLSHLLGMTGVWLAFPFAEAIATIFGAVMLVEQLLLRKSKSSND